MSLPPVPKELGIPARDIHTLFLYLQRWRDGFSDEVTAGGGGNGNGGGSYSDEQAQDAVGLIIADTPTVNATYDDVTPQLTWNVVDNASIQKVEVAENGLLVSTRKRLNFIETQYQQVEVLDAPGTDSTNITISSTSSRLAVSGLPVTLKDTQSMVVSRYYEIQGSIELQGNAALEVL